MLIFVVQCRFDEAIRFINEYVSSVPANSHDECVGSTVDRLLVVSNILTSIHSSKGDLQFIENNIMIQLNYYSLTPLLLLSSRKEKSPLLFSIFQFLLLYIHYVVDTNYTRVREENDQLITHYLSVTNNGRILAIEDVFVILRYLSNTSMLDYCGISLGVSWIVDRIRASCIQKGYLIGIVLLGLGSPRVKSLLQVRIRVRVLGSNI